MASVLAIWCWGNELYPSAIGPQPPADRLLPGVALTHGNSMSVFPMENFPLPLGLRLWFGWVRLA